MPAIDSQAILANGVTITAVGRGTDVATTPGAAMEGVPGPRAHQVVAYFTGAITATSLVIVIEEKILSVAPSTYVYRPIGIMHFGIVPAASGTWDTGQPTSSLWTADPTATFASNGQNYVKCIFEATPGPGGSSTAVPPGADPVVGQCVGITYNVIQYAGGGSAIGFTAYVLPFEGSGKPVQF